MTLDQTDTAVSVALGLLALLGVVFGWLRWIRPRVRRVADRVGAALDTIGGREPIVDSVTGRELAPALPSIGQRMDTMERTVATLAQQQAHQRVQDQLIAELRSDVTAIQGDVEQLKDGTIERVATKAESVAAWRAMEAVAKHGPGDEHPELD